MSQSLSALRLLIVLSALLMGGTACERLHLVRGDAPWPSGTAPYDLQVGDDVRSFLVHIPDQSRRSRLGFVRRFPLIVLLHGSGADAETIRQQSRFDSLADVVHVVTVYPNGATGLLTFGSDWNAGTCCGASARNKVDDIAFIRTVIENVSRHVPIDSRRIYVAGFSDGGSMAYHVACALAPMVAAIGVVSGSLVDDRCIPSRPVPVIAFHGTADREVPYLERALTPASHPPEAGIAGVPPSVVFWADQDGCNGPLTTQVAPHVTRLSFARCSGADVVLYTLAGGVHAWPGGERDGPGGAEPSAEVNASEVLLAFFRRHVRR